MVKRSRILGVYTLRFFRSMIVQFVLVGVVFWCFHWICPIIHEQCKQNPKSPMGVAPQVYKPTAPLYASPNVRFRIDADPALKQDDSGKRLNTWILLPLIFVVVYFITSRAILREGQSIPLPVLLVAVMGLKVFIDVSVALINGGFATLSYPISRALEYYADVPKVEGIRSFLGNFNNLNLSLHSETHPPGGALFLWIVAKLFDYDLLTASFAIILFSTLTLIPIYLLARQFYGEKIGRYSLVLCLITPNMVLFTATCTDAVFTVFLVWSIYLYFRAVSHGSIFFSVLTGVSTVLSMLMNFTTTTLGIYLIVFTIIAYIGGRFLARDDVKQQLKRHLKVLLIIGGMMLLCYLFLYLSTGYSVLANLKSAVNRDEEGMGTGRETFARYVFLSLANLFAFFIYVGVPTTALWVRETVKNAIEAIRRVKFDSFIITNAAWIMGVAFSTLFTLEVERIWMFMLPFVLIPSAKHLAAYIEERKSLSMFYLVASLLWLQILLFEILLDTRW